MEAIKHWRKADPILAELGEEVELEPLPDMANPFDALVQAIVAQQVSLAAGRTIFGRLVEVVGELSPDAVLNAGEDALRSAGLSRAKATYCIDLALHVVDRRLDLHALEELDDEAVIAALTAVKGIGIWSAKMFLIFQLRRPDVCPFEDLGVRLAVERFYGIPEKEAAKWIRTEAMPKWSPHNSLAARVLWNARRT